jgi:hypothetical protein
MIMRNKFYGRVMQQLNLIESNQTSPDVPTPTGATYSEAPNQDQSREERTGQDPNDSSVKTETKSSPWITNVFPPTVKASQIKFNLPDNPEAQKEIVNAFGFVPIIWYNSFQIETSDVQFLQLSENGKFTTIKNNFQG